jgi:nucleoid-associated protein YgaU
MGMANRMHRMADALVSIGVVVHVILHADTMHPATTLPGMRLYSGAMREQYTKALAAAGDELRLGVVFANMVTVRLRKRLGVLQKGLVQRAARNDRRGDASQAEQLRVQARLADTSLAPFTDEWPEEQCMHWLASQQVPTVVVTDDVHYQRAPLVLEEAGLCDPATSCPAIGRWMEHREISLYGAARTVFTVSTEDSEMIKAKLAAAAAAQPAAAATAQPAAAAAAAQPAAAAAAAAAPPAAAAAAAAVAVAHSALALAVHEQRQRRCGGPSVVWVPYVDTLVDKASLQPFMEREDGLLYLGGRHAIAEMGVAWLLNEVQPHAKLLGAQLVEHGRGHLVLIGPGWDDELVHSSVEGVLLTARRQGRISVLGTISDKKLGESMQRYRVLAAPAFNMTGVATKNIHALASGLPLVTTSEGLRGMHLPEGQDVVFVRDNATEFAQTVMLIQRNATMFHVAQARGLAHANRMFTMAVQAEVLCKALGCEGRQAAAAKDVWSAWNAARLHLAAH